MTRTRLTALFAGALDFCSSFRWGARALISLFVSILSGLVLALQYNPAEPFHSTTAIALIAPFGSFWRALHYYSSQAFFLFLFCHFAAVIYQNRHEYSRAFWIRLTLSLPTGLLLLFTGYVLRGDATGEAAGTIAEHITLSLPIIGRPLNSLLFDLSESGMKRVYTNHLIGLMVLGTWCVWPHLRRYMANWRDHALLLLFFLLLSILWTAPLEIERFGILHINGPWFFLGLQELLRYLPPLHAGVFFPSLLLCTLLFLPHQGHNRRRALLGIGLWLLMYAIMSWYGFLRG